MIVWGKCSVAVTSVDHRVADFPQASSATLRKDIVGKIQYSVKSKYSTPNKTGHS